MDILNTSQRQGETKEDVLINYTLLNLIASQGLTQAAFARKLSIDRALLNRIIRNKEKPSWSLMIKIAKTLNTDSRVIWP